jgi:hypothetical protein
MSLQRATNVLAGERSAAPERAGVSPSGAGSEASRVVMSGERSAAPERAGVSPSGAGSEPNRAHMAGERSAAPERAGLSPSGAGSGASRVVMTHNARLIFGAALAVHALMVAVALATALVFSLIVRPSRTPESST